MNFMNFLEWWCKRHSIVNKNCPRSFCCSDSCLTELSRAVINGLMHTTILPMEPVVVHAKRESWLQCNRSSSAQHSVCTFFPSPFNPVGKGSGHAQTTRDMAERQSPDGNKRPRGTPTFLTPVRPNSVSSWSSSPRETASITKAWWPCPHKECNYVTCTTSSGLRPDQTDQTRPASRTCVPTVKVNTKKPD